jgi:hypothetical protein
MKAFAFSELLKILNTPEKQSMDILMNACKQASQMLKGQEAIYKKGAELAALLSKVSDTTSTDSGGSADGGVSVDTNEVLAPSSVAAEFLHVPGGLNLYLTSIRPVKGQKDFNIVEGIRILRDASGEVNSAPRMTLMKAKEILDNLSLGDQSIFIRTFKLADEATEIVKDLASVGIIAELRR